ncbi:CLUMA_CG004178, isoform A [Clunio marinus]|uniref:CLUMA_CG004178, isoform A n=1 Tax=Clunio marinus TaxID=568069 RepID=A0A1J1HQZ7_9DIPT|nr:CLUMA_CG004178, isoform A [Clunio marinus]
MPTPIYLNSLKRVKVSGTLKEKKRINETAQTILFTSAQIKEIEETHFEKCWDVLPKDDEKKKVIFAAFAKRLGLVVGSLSKPKSREILKQEKLVRDFYINDDISEISNKKNHRYMLLSMQEAHDTFKVDFPKQKISYQRFTNLKPDFIKTLKQIPHNTCLCSIHQNMRFALLALASVYPTSKDVVIGINMHKNFICDGENKVCFSNKCCLCKHSPAFFEKFQENEVNATKSVTWEQWQKAPGGGIFSQVERATKTGSESDLIKHIKEMKNLRTQQLPFFKWIGLRALDASTSPGDVNIHVETAQVPGRFSTQFQSFIESSINENELNESLHDTSSNLDDFEPVSTGDSSHSAPATEEILGSDEDQRPLQLNTEGVQTHLPPLTEVSSQEVPGSDVEPGPVQQKCLPTDEYS